MRLSYNIHCRYSGIQIATLEYETCAGHMPYLSHWNEMTAVHPVFSLPAPKLLAFCRGEYDRIAQLSDPSPQEEALLRVAFLALLHSLESIKQEVASLPPWHIVQSQMPRVFVLVYWKHHLQSKRFAFPEFKINQFNNNDRFQNISYYIDACFERKADYEAGVKEADEKAKAKAAEEALRVLRSAWIVPNNKRELWRWVRAHLPQRYQADAEGWMGTLFLGNDSTVIDFDADEVDMMQGIIEGECPAGTPILKAVRDRLDVIRDVINTAKHAFEVDYEQIEMPAVEEKEPKQADYPSMVAFVQARAKWFLAQQKRKQQPW